MNHGHQEPFLEAGDVGKLLGLTAAAVRQAASRGRIPVAAVTLRGGRLFLRSDVVRARRRWHRRTPARPDARPARFSRAGAQ